MIFQEPMTSLNPIMTVGEQLSEAILNHRRVSRREARAEAISLLNKVRIPAAASRRITAERPDSAAPKASTGACVRRDSARAQEAATNMKITAQDLLDLKIIDGIIAEKVGGAHRNKTAVIEATGLQIGSALEELSAEGLDLRAQRREKFLSIGRNL